MQYVELTVAMNSLLGWKFIEQSIIITSLILLKWLGEFVLRSQK